MGGQIRKKMKNTYIYNENGGKNKQTTIKLRINTCMCGPASSFAVTEAPKALKPREQKKKEKHYICNET